MLALLLGGCAAHDDDDGDGRCEPAAVDEDFGELRIASAGGELATRGVVQLLAARGDQLERVAKDRVRFEVDVAAGTTGLTVQLVGAPAVSYWICDWQVDGVAIDGWYSPTGDGSQFASPGLMMGHLPFGPPMTVPSGHHAVELCAVDAALDDDVRVWAFAKTIAIDEGELALDVHFAEGTSDDPETDARTLADDIAAILAGASIDIGEVKTHELPAGCAIVDDDELPEIRTHASAGDPLAIQIFVVDDYRFDTALAVSDGIPGPVVRSSVGAGIVVQRDTPGYDPGEAAAHEIGHHLGLFHTITDEFFEFQDPLPDTDGARDGNLMHPFAGGLELSPMQGQVMRTSVFLRPHE